MILHPGFALKILHVACCFRLLPALHNHSLGADTAPVVAAEHPKEPRPHWTPPPGFSGQPPNLSAFPQRCHSLHPPPPPPLWSVCEPSAVFPDASHPALAMHLLAFVVSPGHRLTAHERILQHPRQACAGPLLLSRQGRPLRHCNPRLPGWTRDCTCAVARPVSVGIHSAAQCACAQMRLMETSIFVDTDKNRHLPIAHAPTCVRAVPGTRGIILI